MNEMPIDPLPGAPAPKPAGWKRQPLALWAFLALGAGRIILSGIDLVLFRRKR